MTKREVYSDLILGRKFNYQGIPIDLMPWITFERVLTGLRTSGDRLFKDDEAIVGGQAELDGRKVLVIGQPKGRNTEENLSAISDV